MKHKENSFKHHYFILKIILLILILGFLGLKIFSLFEHTQEHQLAKEYFKENNNKSVQEWMHLRLISKEFKIPKQKLDDELGVKLHPKESTKPLSEICKRYQLNCTIVISHLNELHNESQNSRNPNNIRGDRR